MKKIAILLATVATLAAVVSAPAEARGRRIHNPGATTAGLVAGAVVAATIANEYGYGPGYYGYGPRVYGGPVYYGAYNPYRVW